MSRRLFCQISPWCYDISVWKGCLMRRLRDCLGNDRFCKRKSNEPLPVLIYRHKSLILRRLGNVDMRLQKNKAVNLSLAAPHIDGVLIRSGETFSLWRLVGRTSAKKGYREGLMIKQGVPSSGIGGGLCQLSNLIHWLVLHSPLEITERHHHDGFDLFPDSGRQVPFGVGTSISYNYLDYRFRNTIDQSFQLIIKVEGEYLCGELRAERPLQVKYHIQAKDEHFTLEGDAWYRNGEVWRTCIDKATGRQISEELLQRNHARVMYEMTQEESSNRLKAN